VVGPTVHGVKDAEPMVPLPLLDWIDANKDDFAPPVSNKVVWADSTFITMVVRGPNARNDFHIDPFDEIFQQLHGSIRVDLIVDGERQEHIVREGEMFLVPGGVPHAPMRPADSWGLVIEQPRPDGTFDELVWFCEECGCEIHRRTFHMSNIEVELRDILNEVNADQSARSCPNGHVLAVPEPFVLDAE